LGLSVEDCFLWGTAGFEVFCAMPGLVAPEPFGCATSAGAGVALRDASLVENMRVRRSFTEAFSAGLWSWSAELEGTGCCPFWATRLGDRDVRSTEVPDLTDDGCDERCEVLDLGSGVVAMFSSNRR
jgi:hypothetical protein